MHHFNPIQSKWVVAAPMRRVCLLQQSILFGIAVLYTLVQNNLQFVALKARKTSSLHTILFKKKHKQTKQLVVLIFNRAYFSSKED